MNSFQRTVFLAVLIPFAFATLTVIETGGFILPFPLNEIIFAITAYIFTIRLLLKQKLESLFVFLFATLNLFSTEFIWSLFTFQDSLQKYYEEGVFDTIRFFSYLMLFGWLMVSMLRKVTIVRSVITTVAVLIFLVGLVNQWYYLMVIATYIPFIASLKYPDMKPYNLLWLLLSVLNTMTLIMFQMAKA